MSAAQPEDTTRTTFGAGIDKEGPGRFEGALHRQDPLRASEEDWPADVREQLGQDAAQIIARYPQKRSALLPLLHLLQSIDGYITGRGVNFCADLLDLATAEVAGVATFYTQYKRHPNGEYTVGVCTNTLCAIMGGDQIFETVSERLGIGHDETTPDGKITLEGVECNAACDFAPVVMVNWEFFDNQTPESAAALVGDLRQGKPVTPTRGAGRVCTFKQVSRVLAGFNDGLSGEGVGAGAPSLAGLKLAQERGWTAPGDSAAQGAQDTTSDRAPQTGGEHSSTDSPATGDKATDSPATGDKEVDR